MKFSEMDLPREIQEALVEMGFEETTPIQDAVYSIIREGRDLCALAETGSGKTAACAIPLLQKVDPSHNAIQGLVIVPTRELCIQYVDEIHHIGKKTKVVPFAAFGGFSKGIQMSKLRHEVHLLVATPGRLIDLIYSGAVDLNHLKCVILDEADELLKEGFADDIEFVLSCLMHDYQTLLFAATMADDIQQLANRHLRDPEHISLIEKRPSPKSIDHYFTFLKHHNKKGQLLKFLSAEDVNQAIIFCNSRRQVDILFRELRNDFRDIDFIHGGLIQDKRTSIFRRFKKRQLLVLISTDVAGRGLDFMNVSHIVNWDFPPDLEQYTHRTGRSGRMGRKGKALSLVTQRDLHRLPKLFMKNKIKPRWLGRDPFGSPDHTISRRPPRRRRPPPKMTH